MPHFKGDCCVKSCTNTKKNCAAVFYSFSKVSYKLPQREKWIEAVRVANKTPEWVPKDGDRICSVHFIGNSKSDETMSPSYVPTLFPNKKLSSRNLRVQTAALNRHNEFMKQRSEEILKKIREREIKKRQSTMKVPEFNPMDYNTIYLKTEQDIEPPTKPTIHQECQVETLIQCSELSKTFICNRYIYNSHGEVQIQTDIEIPELSIKQERVETEENFT